MMEKTNWIIAISGDEMSTITAYRVFATKTRVKKHLVDLVLGGRANDKKRWKYGTDDIFEVEEKQDGVLYAYGEYEDYRVDYSAIPEMDPIEL